MITYSTEVKTARMTATRDEVAGGTIEIRDSTDAVLVVYDLTTEGGTVTGDTWSVGVDASGVAATASGTADHAVIKDATDAIQITGLDVGISESGAIVIIDSLSISEGQTITFVSGSIQHGADPA